ncbi:NRDE family protein [Leucobacter weissii]|uniref:NRDE family protein n=1 Tax=Leucobacter weissii TaxID=1983706 RepID=A0A939MIU5_9MICO|nr:NRDE family protein [Leucobacter weissii]MBO1901381.1 NRDE family protein [Leucobacter weissii]
MCTVVVEVPASPDGSLRLLAVRDEEPGRAWDPPGRWWPDRPGTVGVRDRRANGAWLAASAEHGRLAVILNRAASDAHGRPEASNRLASRGELVLDDVEGARLRRPRTANFNLVSVEGTRASVTGWDGAELTSSRLAPGVHMIAHHDVDDAARTPRIARWLPEFRALAGAPGPEWRERWLSILRRSAAFAPEDDRAIIRDNRSHGYPTLSLLVCLAELDPEPAGAGLRLDAATLAEPARLGRLDFATTRL